MAPNSAFDTLSSSTSSTNSNSKSVYQFRVYLKGSNPPIWRRIQVPGDYNFAQLHKAINIAMGWADWHRHFFEMEDLTRIGAQKHPADLFGLNLMDEDEKTTLIADYFKVRPGWKGASYVYDLNTGGWEHVILLEGIYPALAEKKYPICLAGKQACPPEGVSGVAGYNLLLKILQNPNHPEYKEQKEWVEEMEFNLAKKNFFDPTAVSFAEMECHLVVVDD